MIFISEKKVRRFCFSKMQVLKMGGDLTDQKKVH